MNGGKGEQPALRDEIRTKSITRMRFWTASVQLMGFVIVLGALYGFIQSSSFFGGLLSVLSVLLGIWLLWRVQAERQFWLGLVGNVSPKPMTMSFESVAGGDVVTDYALLKDETGKEWRVPVLATCKTESFRSGVFPVLVYSDPDNNEPAVIETDQGYLWVFYGIELFKRIMCGSPRKSSE